MSRYALKIGTPLIAHYLSQQVQNQFDRIAITRLINSAATGIYSFAYTIANILQIIFYSINNVFTVWSYERLKAQEYERLRTCAKKYIALMVFLTIGLMSISKELIMIAGHSSYWEGQYVFLPITVGIFLLFLYTIPVIIEYYFKETKYIALMTCIAAGVNIVTNYIFIPKYGYIAAAYTTMLSYGVQFTAHWFISLQIMKKYGLPQIYKFTDFLAPFAEVLLAALAISYLNGYPVIKYCALLIYIALMFCKYREDITVIIKKHFLKGGSDVKQ
jgi:O-antigen/teichoic acid export membrane protein